MSRRDDYLHDRYEDRDQIYRPRPRRDREYEEVDIDIRRSNSRGPDRRAETVVLDRRDDRREDRRERNHDFLREDYGRPTEAQQIVIREELRDDDTFSRVSRRRGDAPNSRARGPDRVNEEELVIRERERERIRSSRPPYPSSDIGRGERDNVREEIVFRDRERSRGASRAPPPPDEEIDISIRRREDNDDRRSSPPRSEAREADIRETRGRDHRDGRRPPTIVIEREEIDTRERRRASPPRDVGRGGAETREEIDIRIREADRLDHPRQQRSRSRSKVVARKEEEWIVRRPRRDPSPPPRDYEKEEIIIRRRERSSSPDPPPREPSPEPVPELEPIVRPPIVQEVITHYRNIDHGFERAREPSPPSPISPPHERDEDLEIAIRRSGVRNGKSYDDELVIERDQKGREERPSVPPARRRSPSRSGYEREIIAREIDYSARRLPVASPTMTRHDNRSEETRIDLRRTTVEDRPRTKDRLWTEVTKDLVIKEAIEESGYDYEESDEFYYVMEYLRYVREPTSVHSVFANIWVGRCGSAGRVDRRHPTTTA